MLHDMSVESPIHFLSLIVRFYNDPFISEFVDYYLSEGVDMIYIVNDNDTVMNIPEIVLNNPNVTIWYSLFDEASRKEYHKNQMHFCNLLYSCSYYDAFIFNFLFL